MKKVVNKNVLSWIIVVFVLVQSIVELSFLCGNGAPSIFSFSIPTFIRLLFVAIIGVYYLFTTKINKKHIYLFAYLFVVGVYFILHHMNALHFVSLVPGDFGYSLFTEAFYLIRVLIPIFLIIVLFDIKFSKKQILFLLISLSILVSGSIIVSDLFLLGNGSYSKVKILGNIFTWFGSGYKKYTYYGLACMGFFHDPNRLSAFMLLLTGSIFCMIYSYRKNYMYILLGLQMIAMCMIGTKVATYGFGLLLIGFILIYLFNCLILRNEKANYKFLLVLLLFGLVYLFLLGYAPCKDRTSGDKIKIDESLEEENIEELNSLIVQMEELDQKKDKKDLIDFMYEHSVEFNMNEGFINYAYPILYDYEFWYGIYKLDYQNRYNYRFIEESMLKRIKNINHNKNDDYLGITFTRMSNVFELERDFKAQYYSMGIIGVLLLFIPYIVIIFVSSIYILFKIKRRFNVNIVFLLYTCCVFVGAAYFSGNILDSLFTMIPYSALLGYVLGGIINYEN